MIRISALSAVLLAATPVAAQDGEEFGVRAQREAFNIALEARDIEGVEAVLDEDVVLVTGTGSQLLLGRDAQLKVWAEDFADPGSAAYVRTPSRVSLSPLYPLAFEQGTWRGASRGKGSNWASGTYFAKWRKTDGVWRLEAETFMTTGCGGEFCLEGQ